MRHIVFDFPTVVMAGLPLLLCVLLVSAWAQRRNGARGARVVASTLLRGVVLLVLILLAARPGWVKVQSQERKSVLLLIDRSASMSLKGAGRSRFDEVVGFARDALVPSLAHAGLSPKAYLFAENAAETDGAGVADAVPDGTRTDLSQAIVHSLASAGGPCLAVIALTDGAANVHTNDNGATSTLLETATPLFAVGFGSASAVNTLSLQQIIAPQAVRHNQEFRISAQLEKNGTGDMLPFDLLLLKNGRLVQNKTVAPGSGRRLWLESFTVAEESQGEYVYTLQIQPPQAEGLKCLNRLATAQVHVTGGDTGRVLFVQGAPGWDYKFVRLALRDDPARKLTGLTRTSPQTFFRQNVERLDELAGGFPSTVQEISPFQVVVLANLKAADLSLSQQESLVRFCGEFGGGVLIVGGAETFGASWNSGPMKDLLPVQFAPASRPSIANRGFRLQLTDVALNHTVFQTGDDRVHRAAWNDLPDFSRYARASSTKLGATVWAEHPTDRDQDRRPRALIAHQRYGAGISMVICTPDLWSWRLSRGADTRRFDRFWRQLLQFLSAGGGADVVFHFPDQELRPESDIRVVVERRPDAKNPNTTRRYGLRVEDSQAKILKEQSINIAPGKSLEVSFHVPTAGIYTIEAAVGDQFPVASRSVEIRDTNIELQHAARDMEHLRQWANVTGGAAVEFEACEDVDELTSQIASAGAQQQRTEHRRMPAGMNGWTLVVLLLCLCAEWLLRKRWRLP